MPKADRQAIKWIVVALTGLFLWLAMGCGPASTSPMPTPRPSPSLETEQLITLGDIDPDEPTKKIKRFAPLADYLAEQLKESGIAGGRVVIARDINEMATFLKEGTLDVYFDSPFPTLRVQELSGSEIILRRWKGGIASYWSTYVALRESGVTSVADFVGKVIAVEEPRSTSGFILPAGTLVQRGYSLSEVDTPGARVASDKIAYFFSRDEENTFELVLEGKVAGGGVSNEDYEELPPELKRQIIAFDKTIEVPRQLVSVRPELDPELVRKLTELLVNLDQTEEGRQILQGLKETAKFDALPAEAEASLQALKELIELVTRD